MNINILVNTNHEAKQAYIESGAIYEFTTIGFAEGTYDATVSFSCLPAAVDSNALEIVLDNMQEFAEYGETIAFYGKICKRIIKFLNKCHGYKKTLTIEDVQDSEIIDIPDDMSEVELQAKILAILMAQQKNTAKDVKRIMGETAE